MSLDVDRRRQDMPRSARPKVRSAPRLRVQRVFGRPGPRASAAPQGWAGDRQGSLSSEMERGNVERLVEVEGLDCRGLDESRWAQTRVTGGFGASGP